MIILDVVQWGRSTVHMPPHVMRINKIAYISCTSENIYDKHRCKNIQYPGGVELVGLNQTLQLTVGDLGRNVATHVHG